MSTRPRCKGQAMIETALLIAVTVGALVAMAHYLKRAYNGYLYSNAGVHGGQFDPSGDYTAKQFLDTFKVEQTVDISSAPAVKDFQGQQDGSGSCDGMDFSDDCLPSVPGGAHPPSVVRTKTVSKAWWMMRRENSYEAQ